jgi:glycine betaine/proline transport system ATP-binding protein
VLDNVAMPLEIRQVSKNERMRQAAAILDIVELGAWGAKFAHELSGGMQQRVGLARALAANPDVLLMDEPFSALDPLIRREMQDEFLRLQQMLNKTIVFITHDFDEALRLADRIAIMKNGAIEQCDTPDQIVLHPATEYVRKFTEDIDKARVVHAAVLVDAAARGEGEPVDGRQTVHALARMLVNDSRTLIPVKQDDKMLGAMQRQAALDILLGAS